MGKVSIRRCDKCARLDSQDDPVERVQVVAIRRDLCTACRVAIVMSFDVAETDAVLVVAEQNLSREQGRHNVARAKALARGDVLGPDHPVDPDQMALDED